MKAPKPYATVMLHHFEWFFALPAGACRKRSTFPKDASWNKSHPVRNLKNYFSAYLHCTICKGYPKNAVIKLESENDSIKSPFQVTLVKNFGSVRKKTLSSAKRFCYDIKKKPNETWIQ